MSDIRENCPYCEKEYRWDNHMCWFVPIGSNAPTKTLSYSVAGEYSLDKEVTIYLCSCGAVLATMVSDEFGAQLYTPCTKDV